MKDPLVSLVGPARWARKVSRWWVLQALLESQARRASQAMGDKERLVLQDPRGLLEPRRRPPQDSAQDFCPSPALPGPLDLLALQVTLHL